jgi:hypothetical protein
MSYSRWIDSSWYTFWCTTKSEEKDDQEFSIDCEIHFTYKELRNDLAGCLKKIKEHFPKATRKEIAELRGYIQDFILDVAKEYCEKETHKCCLCGDEVAVYWDNGAIVEDGWLCGDQVACNNCFKECK